MTNIGVLDNSVISAALESAGLAVIITDLDLKAPGPIIRYVNPMFEDMTGYAASEVIGQSPRILQGPLTDGAVLDELKLALERDDYFCGETVNYRKSGEPYVVRWIITPVAGPDGAPTHWIALLTGVTGETRPRQTYAGELEKNARAVLDDIEKAQHPQTGV